MCVAQYRSVVYSVNKYVLNVNYNPGNGMDAGDFRVKAVRCGVSALDELLVELWRWTLTKGSHRKKHGGCCEKEKKHSWFGCTERDLLDGEAPEGFPKTETTGQRSES